MVSELYLNFLNSEMGGSVPTWQGVWCRTHEKWVTKHQAQSEYPEKVNSKQPGHSWLSPLRGIGGASRLPAWVSSLPAPSVARIWWEPFYPWRPRPAPFRLWSRTIFRTGLGRLPCWSQLPWCPEKTPAP